MVEKLSDLLTLEFVEDQSSSVADFVVKSKGETVGVLEATLSTDQEAEALESALRDKKKGGLWIERKLCHSDWWICPANDAHIGTIREKADRYLRDIEIDGMTSFSELDKYQNETVERIYKDLRIEYGQKVQFIRPGIGLSGSSSGGRTSNEEVLQAAEAEMFKPDNLKKLGATGKIEKHFFVEIGYLKGAASISILHCDPPETLPVLPAEVTHLWIAARGGEYAWVWLATSSGWKNFSAIKLEQ